MATVAASAVTIVSQWSEGSINGKRRSGRVATVVLSSQGTLTNPIPASVFRLASIESCSAAMKSDNAVIVPCSPSIDGLYLVLGGGASNAPADYTGTFTVTVYGQSV